ITLPSSSENRILTAKGRGRSQLSRDGPRNRHDGEVWSSRTFEAGLSERPEDRRGSPRSCEDGRTSRYGARPPFGRSTAARVHCPCVGSATTSTLARRADYGTRYHHAVQCC